MTTPPGSRYRFSLAIIALPDRRPMALASRAFARFAQPDRNHMVLFLYYNGYLAAKATGNWHFDFNA